MKRLFFITLLLSLFFAVSNAIPPYYRIAVKSGSIESVASEYKNIIEVNGLSLLGEYHPGNNPALFIVAFTCPKLKEIATGVDERGALAAVMKLGFVSRNGMIEVSILNPDYIFHAYLRSAMESSRRASDLEIISKKIFGLFTSDEYTAVPFGGDLTAEQLHKYHYMMGMPYFDDPVVLKNFASFEEGLATIRDNLEKNGSLVKVYELYEPDSKVAVFGVGIPDSEKGEARFLPIIGEDHAAAMPYEIILQGNRATMLHGRYRFALLWPELKMSTFTKIMSTPGDIEDFMKLLVE